MSITPEKYLKDYMQYNSVRRYVRHLKKKSVEMERGGIPKDTLQGLLYSLKFFSNYTNKNPDQWITEATETIRRDGNTLTIDDQLDEFWESIPKKTCAGSYFSYIKSFYRFNGIYLNAETPGKPTIRKKMIHLQNDAVRSICDVMPLQHASWWLCNNYMGLRLGGFTNLTVEDFGIENFTKNMPMYPVFVSKQIGGYFDYTTYIGYDAMLKLRTYIAKKGLSKNDKIWDFDHNALINRFKIYAYRAGIIEAPNGFNELGAPRGLCTLGTHSQRRRSITIQESVGTNRNWVDHLHGHVPKGSDAKHYSFPEDATPEDLYNEVLKALPKKEIYGHHEMSPTEPTVELQRFRILQDAKELKNMTPEKYQELENLLKCVRTQQEINTAISNIMIVTRSEIK